MENCSLKDKYSKTSSGKLLYWKNITLSKFQGDTRNSFPDIAFRIYINPYEKLAICTWVGTKYCILSTLSQRVLYLKTL